MLSKDQFQGQVKYGHQIKMQHECCVTHVLWVIWAQNSLVASISKFDPRKRQCNVKLGQTRPNFETQNLLTKTCLFCPVVCQDSKNVFFSVRQLVMPKIAFKK